MVSPMLIVWTKGDQLTNAYIRLNVSAIKGHYMHINTKVVSEKKIFLKTILMLNKIFLVI